MESYQIRSSVTDHESPKSIRRTTQHFLLSLFEIRIDCTFTSNPLRSINMKLVSALQVVFLTALPKPSQALLGDFYTGLLSVFNPGLLAGTCDDVKEFLFPASPFGPTCICNADVSTFLFFFASGVNVAIECQEDNIFGCPITGGGSVGFFDILFSRSMDIATTIDCDLSDLPGTPVDSFTLSLDTSVGISGNEIFPELLSCEVVADPAGADPPADCGCQVCPGGMDMGAFEFECPASTMFAMQCP